MEKLKVGYTIGAAQFCNLIFAMDSNSARAIVEIISKNRFLTANYIRFMSNTGPVAKKLLKLGNSHLTKEMPNASSVQGIVSAA